MIFDIGGKSNLASHVWAEQLENVSRFVLPSLSSCQCFSLERITNMACLGGKTSSNPKVEKIQISLLARERV